MKTTIIGIAGPEAAGKTTMAKALSGLLKCEVIHLDRYFVKDNWPLAHDWVKVWDRLRELVGKVPVVIVEGIKLEETMSKTDFFPDFIIHIGPYSEGHPVTIEVN